MDGKNEIGCVSSGVSNPHSGHTSEGIAAVTMVAIPDFGSMLSRGKVESG